MDTVIWVQILDEADCISHWALARYESNNSLSSYGLIEEHIDSLNISMSTGLG